jgi:cysteine-S-conjugate beta-lyase
MSRFDEIIDRHGTGANKWSRYGADVLPLWLADMDFAAPDCVVRAVAARAAHPVYGYAAPQADLRATIVEDLARRHGWHVAPEEIVFLPGVEPGFNMALSAFLTPGAGVALHTPAYRPMRRAPGFWGLRLLAMPLQRNGDTWAADAGHEREAVAQAGALLLCNPHNPTGKVFARPDLERLAEQALAHDTLIISDEIHADLLLDGRRHVPMASLSPEVARRTITLMSPGKSFNTSGLKAAFAVVGDPQLRARFDARRLGMVDSVNAFGLAAMQAAYADGHDWLAELLAYLQANRDWLVRAVADRLPGVTMAAPEATFLAWLDCRGAGITGSAQAHFLNHARVALGAGEDFADQGEGFVRLNFGCPRALLAQAIDRMAASL